MKKSVFLLVVCVMLYIRLPPTNQEIVWLKDVTTSFETDKRTLSDPDLPDELTFHLSRGSHTLTLNMKRNHGIDPNANVYVVQTLKNGESLLEKTHLEKEDVAYYQDRENWASMTIRCVKSSNRQCNRAINGNLRIGDRNYDLRPAETDVTLRNLLDLPDLLGTRYVLLHDQANNQRDISIEKNKDAANVNEKNVEQELTDLLRRSPREHDKRNHFPPTHFTLSSRNVAGLHNQGTTDKKDNVKQVYWVEMVILLDSGIWDLYSSLVETNYVQGRDGQVERKIREAYSHYINGVNLLYNGIEDSGIEISVTLREFYIFKMKGDFPHRSSVVKNYKGTDRIEVHKYAFDIAYWDRNLGTKYGIDYDHVMLFTRYDLYDGNIRKNDISGFSKEEGVCDVGDRISVIESRDYFLTVNTAAHELGHNLGAVHDGERDAISCPDNDSFIMTSYTPQFHLDLSYSRNPWLFSNCSVAAFKKTLKNKMCVTNKGVFFDNEEWNNYTMKLPGEVYTPNQQCELANGRNSLFCGTVSPYICTFMTCTDPKTGVCMRKYFGAARGTSCEENMWCKEGICVPRTRK